MCDMSFADLWLHRVFLLLSFHNIDSTYGKKCCGVCSECAKTKGNML